jgi:hypothetical protein
MPVQGTEVRRWFSSNTFVVSVLERVGGQYHPRETTGAYCTRGCVGLEPEKSRPSLGFNTQTIQPVANRYTDYVVPAVHKRKLEKTA